MNMQGLEISAFRRMASPAGPPNGYFEVLPNGVELTPAAMLGLGMRRSCDHCGRKKKKCDGRTPCSRCVESCSACTYSKRRWHLPQPQQEQQEQQQQQLDRPGPDDLTAREVQVQSTTGERLANGMLSLKRCRLSASPATGLVGMQENTFLSDFFTSIGFVPFTTQSHIRETMVKLMVPPAALQQSGDKCDCAEAGEFGAILTEGNIALGGDNHPMDPATCTFWCAVALGALVKGSPIESVESYSQLARNGLRSYSGPVNAEVAKAWTILAYVYLLCGNMDMFQEYTALSESFLNASIEQGSVDMLPVGFAEVIGHGTTIKFASGCLSPSEVESFCAQTHVPPQLNKFATESELYRYIRRSYRVIEQAVYEKACSHSASTAGGHSNGAEPDNGGAGVDPFQNMACSEFLDTMIEQFSDNCGFDRLEDAVDRPSIRSGIGAVIINGPMFLKKAAEGDLSGTLESIGRCVEVYERFPGLCRFVMMSHTVHIMVIALAAIDGSRARELYNTLKAAYNSTRRPGAPPLPPVEEWQGISPCCDFFYCSSMERLILSGEMKCFPTRPDSHVVTHHKDIDGDGEEMELLGLDGYEESEHVSTNEEVVGSFPYSSCSSGAESDLSSTRKASPWSSPVMGSTLAPTVPTTSVASSFNPNCESHAGLNPDLHSHEGVAHVVGNDTDVVAQPPETLPTMSAGFSEWGGVKDGAGDEDGLAPEDWLDVADALDAVAEPEPGSAYDKYTTLPKFSQKT